MPIDYHIAKVKIVASRSDNSLQGSVHHRVHARSLIDGQLRDLQLAVNALSRTPPLTAGANFLLFLIDEQFQHPITEKLPPFFALQAMDLTRNTRESREFLQQGGMVVRPAPEDREVRLDYLRSGLFDPARLQVLPPSRPGRQDDLQDHLRQCFQRAQREKDSWVYVFGELWAPKPTDRGRPVHFDFERDPAKRYGMHDIHMNQGNEPRYAQADGTYQDGGLLFHFPRKKQWVAVFLAFQGQAWTTDDGTGHRL